MNFEDIKKEYENYLKDTKQEKNKKSWDTFKQEFYGWYVELFGIMDEKTKNIRKELKTYEIKNNELIDNGNIKIKVYPFEIAEKLIELSKDMDFMDYEEDEEKIKSELEEALYWLKAAAENEYNKEYFRTLYRVLENL